MKNVKHQKRGDVRTWEKSKREMWKRAKLNVRKQKTEICMSKQDNIICTNVKIWRILCENKRTWNMWKCKHTENVKKMWKMSTSENVKTKKTKLKYT